MTTQTNQSKEEWKYIEGTNNQYIVSNLGSVISLRQRMQTLTKTTQASGYNYVMIEINGKPKNYRLHKLVAMAFVPNPNNYTEINHIDGNKKNNRSDNLVWCNRSMNMRHYYRTLGHKGHPQSEETKQKLRDLWKGKPKSPQMKKNLSNSLKRYYQQQREQKRHSNGNTDNQTK